MCHKCMAKIAGLSLLVIFNFLLGVKIKVGVYRLSYGLGLYLAIIFVE